MGTPPTAATRDDAGSAWLVGTIDRIATGGAAGGRAGSPRTAALVERERLVVRLALARQALGRQAGADRIAIGGDGRPLVGQAIERRVGAHVRQHGFVPVAQGDGRVARLRIDIARLRQRRPGRARDRHADQATSDDVRVARVIGRRVVAVEDLVAEAPIEILRSGCAGRRLVGVVVVLEHRRRAGCRRKVVRRAVDPAPRARARLVFAVGVADVADREAAVRAAHRERPVGVAVERNGDLARQVDVRGERRVARVGVRLRVGVKLVARHHVGVGGQMRERRAVGLYRRRVRDIRIVGERVELGRIERRRLERAAVGRVVRRARGRVAAAAAIADAERILGRAGRRRRGCADNLKRELRGGRRVEGDLERAVVFRLCGTEDRDVLAVGQGRPCGGRDGRRCRGADTRNARDVDGGHAGGNDPVRQVGKLHASRVVQRVDDVGLRLDLGRDRNVPELRLRKGVAEGAEHQSQAYKGDERLAECMSEVFRVHVCFPWELLAINAAWPGHTWSCWCRARRRAPSPGRAGSAAAWVP